MKTNELEAQNEMKILLNHANLIYSSQRMNKGQREGLLNVIHPFTIKTAKRVLQELRSYEFNNYNRKKEVKYIRELRNLKKPSINNII